jgi:hypothetical protein
MADLPKNSAAEIRRLKAISYHDEYLISPWWRRRRHERLKKANGKCERCSRVVRFTDVHHVYYDRIGEERDSDLEVLCRDCHTKLHFEESRRQHMGVYILLARETQRLDKPAPADFKEAFGKRCRALTLVTTDHRFDDAITIVLKEQPVSLVAPARRQVVSATVPELPPIGKLEARDLCRRLGLKFPVKSMPTTYGMRSGVAATRARAAARLKAERCPQCQQKGTAQLSGAQLGWLFCSGCQNKWPLSKEHLL